MGSLNVVRLLKDWKPFGAKPQIQEDLVANHWQSQCMDSETSWRMDSGTRALGGSNTYGDFGLKGLYQSCITTILLVENPTMVSTEKFFIGGALVSSLEPCSNVFVWFTYLYSSFSYCLFLYSYINMHSIWNLINHLY